jgi:Na+-driven multidrug efflux pump
MMATIPSLSFSQALSTFVGQNIGANKTERVRTGLKATIKMAGGITVITTVIIVLMGNIMMRMFTSDTDVIRIGNEYLTIVSAFYLLFTMMFIFNGIMRGAGDTIFPMFFSLVSLWLVRIPLAYYLSARMGESGIWWAIPAGWLIGLILSFFYYRTGRWKASTVVKYFDNM